MSYEPVLNRLVGEWLLNSSPFTIRSSLLDVRFFEAVALLLVYHLEDKAEDEGGHAEAGKHDERGGIVVRHGGFLRRNEAVLKVADELWVGLVEHLTDE